MNIPFLNDAPGMDFVGQQHALTTYRVVIALSAVVGFILGYIRENFNYTIFTVLIATALVLTICVPPWPWFRSHSLPWKKQSTLSKEEAKFSQTKKPENRAPKKSGR